MRQRTWLRNRKAWISAKSRKWRRNAYISQKVPELNDDQITGGRAQSSALLSPWRWMYANWLLIALCMSNELHLGPTVVYKYTNSRDATVMLTQNGGLHSTTLPDTNADECTVVSTTMRDNVSVHLGGWHKSGRLEIRWLLRPLSRRKQPPPKILRPPKIGHKYCSWSQSAINLLFSGRRSFFSQIRRRFCSTLQFLQIWKWACFKALNSWLDWTMLFLNVPVLKIWNCQSPTTPRTVLLTSYYI